MAKINITLTLFMSEIIYDIRNKTDVTGRSRYDGNNDDNVALMKVTDDPEDNNNMLRSIQNALGTLKTKLAEYVSEIRVGGTNEQMAEENIQVALHMPSNFNMAVIPSLTTEMHQYVVNTAIGDWFSMTNKDDASYYMSSAEANLAMMNETINKRIRPLRPDGTTPGGGGDDDEYYVR